MNAPSKKKTIQLIHWNGDEARTMSDKLEALGYTVHSDLPKDSNFLKQIEILAPSSLIISLLRLPSQGRDMALMLRKRKGTRSIPIVFLEGESEKVKKIKDILPDAFYTGWHNISSVLEKAVKRPPRDPIVPDSVFDGYKGKSLVEKLGIQTHSIVTLLNEPHGFRKNLTHLPEGVSFHNKLKSDSTLIIWFLQSKEELENSISEFAKNIEDQSCWIAWPKKSSGQQSNLSQIIVRKAGLSNGLVDFKICSMDSTWSGLLFRKRK